MAKAIAGAVLALAVGACGGGEDAGQAVVEVRRGALAHSASYRGELKARQSVAIMAPSHPEVSWLTYTVATVLEDGTPVQKGDVVLTFDRAQVEELLFQADTQLQLVKAEKRRVEQSLAREKIDLELAVERARMNLERARLNVVEGVNYKSKLEVEQARLDAQKAEAELAQAEKTLAGFAEKRAATLEEKAIALKVAERRKRAMDFALSQLEIRATADGVIFRPLTQLNRVNNERVAPAKTVRSGDKLLEIPDLSAFDLDLAVRQRDAAMINVGDRATVYPTVAPDRPIQGVVVRKDAFATTRNERFGTKTPEGNLKEISVVVELAEATPALKPGGTARAELIARLQTDAVLVPIAAFRDPAEGGRTTVLLAGGGIREIRIGQTSSTHAEVLEGLAPGDRVVLGAAP